MSYAEFISRKTQLADDGGFEPLWMPEFLFDFQASLVEWAIRKGRAAILADCGLGKALAADTPVLASRGGFVAIGDLSPGSFVIGANGNPTEVLGVYPQGLRAGYRVTFSDGASVVCDEEHLWTVRTKGGSRGQRPWRTMTLRELMSIGIGSPGRERLGRWFIPMAEPVELEESDLPLHPYVLGCLLGDGCIIHGTPYISSADPELIEAFNARLPIGYHATKARYSKYDYRIVRSSLDESGRRGGAWSNQVADALRELGVWGCKSEGKFIPDCYKFAARDTREWILRGLLDTDGGVYLAPSQKSPVIEYTSVSKRLAEDVQFVIQSLGGRAQIHTKRTTGQLAYRMHPNFPPGSLPFLLSRKAGKWRDREKYTPTRSIRKVEQVGDVPMVCIKVAAQDGLFLANDCIVTHNTPMELVWAENVRRKTNLPVLILTPLAVAPQMLREAQKFGVEAKRSRDGQAHPCITIANYDMLHRFDPTAFAGVVCDESSCIKALDGVLRARVTEFMRKTPYRLLCTATAAPNDYIELGTHSEALGHLGFVDMLSRFFKNNRNNSATNRMGKYDKNPQWRFRGHAERPFWRWVCSWARAMRRPSDYGFDDARFVLPPLVEHEHTIKPRRARAGFLFSVPAIGLAEEREERRRTIDERCELAAGLVADTGQPAVCWAHLNDEADLIERLIPGAIQVSGKDADEAKEEKFEAFQSGEARVLVTKPIVGAWGLCWHHCAHMTTFTGHSFEQYYQSVRRFWRFGQTRPVVVEHVASDGEAGVLRNLQRKAEMADAMFSELVGNMRNEMALERAWLKTDKQGEVPSWL